MYVKERKIVFSLLSLHTTQKNDSVVNNFVTNKRRKTSCLKIKSKISFYFAAIYLINCHFLFTVASKNVCLIIFKKHLLVMEHIPSFLLMTFIKIISFLFRCKELN